MTSQDDLFQDEGVTGKVARPYQSKSVSQVYDAINNGAVSVCLQLATGGGKTFIASMIAKAALERGRKVTFTVPALSLVDQTYDAFKAEDMGKIGVMQGDHPRTDPLAPTQIATVQTLLRREYPDAGLVIVDECHIKSEAVLRWREMLEEGRDRGCFFIGLSATPWRPGMDKEFDRLVVGATISELIKDGYLSPFRHYAPTTVDLKGIKTVAGDYDKKQLGKAMSAPKLVGDVVSTWLAMAENRPTLVFAVNRAHARELVEAFQRANVPTGYIDAYTDQVERAYIRDQFARGLFKVVVNIGTLTTGVDWDVRCIQLARPTKSEMLYVQMIGRGLRTAPGKADCLILDHSDNGHRLGLVDTVHHDGLLSNDKDAKEAREKRQAEERKPKVCPKCAFVVPVGLTQCPACLWKPGHRPSEVEAVSGNLRELGATASVKKKDGPREKYGKPDAVLGQLLFHAHVKGYKPGWAYAKFRELFNDSPPQSPPPDQFIRRPSPALRNWIKSRQIAYAAMQRKKKQEENARQG